MNQVFLLKLKCFAENLFCWKTPNHLSLSYSHREEMGCLQPLLPLLMFQPSCASPCAHSRSFSQSTHLLNGPNILYWEVYEIFKQYEEEETVLLNKREGHSISVWWVYHQLDGKFSLPFLKDTGHFNSWNASLHRDLWYFLNANTSKAFQGQGRTCNEPNPPLILLN